MPCDPEFLSVHADRVAKQSARYDTLVLQRANGATLPVAASAAGMTAGAAKQLWRRRSGGQPWADGRPRVADRMTQAMTDLAEAMAEGAPSVSEAARSLRLSQSYADQLWQRIRRGLGEQAV